MASALSRKLQEHLCSQSPADFHSNPHATTTKVADIFLIGCPKARVRGWHYLKTRSLELNFSNQFAVFIGKDERAGRLLQDSDCANVRVISAPMGIKSKSNLMDFMLENQTCPVA